MEARRGSARRQPPLCLNNCETKPNASCTTKLSHLVLAVFLLLSFKLMHYILLSHANLISFGMFSILRSTLVASITGIKCIFGGQVSHSIHCDEAYSAVTSVRLNQCSTAEGNFSIFQGGGWREGGRWRMGGGGEGVVD